MLTPIERNFLDRSRLAHLATVDRAGMPHVVPVCYARFENTIYIVLDEKPKRVDPRAVKRVRNILEAPRAAFVADHYDDADWTRLGWVMVRGSAEILDPGREQAMAVSLLRHRYGQYRDMQLEDSPVIAIRAEHVVSWGALAPPEH